MCFSIPSTALSYIPIQSLWDLRLFFSQSNESDHRSSDAGLSSSPPPSAFRPVSKPDRHQGCRAVEDYDDYDDESLQQVLVEGVAIRTFARTSFGSRAGSHFQHVAPELPSVIFPLPRSKQLGHSLTAQRKNPKGSPKATMIILNAIFHAPRKNRTRSHQKEAPKPGAPHKSSRGDLPRLRPIQGFEALDGLLTSGGACEDTQKKEHKTYKRRAPRLRRKTSWSSQRRFHRQTHGTSIAFPAFHIRSTLLREDPQGRRECLRLF